MVAWSWLGRAAPVATLGVIGLSAALLFGRGSLGVRLRRCLIWALAIVGTAWVAAISRWAFGLADQQDTAKPRRCLACSYYQSTHSPDSPAALWRKRCQTTWEA
jgi:hypothetical protein